MPYQVPRRPTQVRQGKDPNYWGKKSQGRREETQSILKKKGNPAAKKTTAPRNAQNENSKGSKRTKGKKKPKGRKVSFDGKKAASSTNSRK